MDERVPGWVRIVMVVGLAGVQLYTGLWALLSPRGWFDGYPGVGPDLVAAETPFNAHLATDAGAAFFCTGVALVAGAAFGRRSGVYVALLAYVAFAAPHAWYHATYHAPGLTSGEHVTSVVALVIGLVIAAVLAWGARRRPAGAASLPGRAIEGLPAPE